MLLQKKSEMDIKLPKGADGQETTLQNSRRQITVVGANGSGKTRFVNRMMEYAGDKAFCFSALDALYSTNDEKPANCITRLYRRAVQDAQFVRPVAETEFDMLLYMLVTDEMTDLLSYKLQNAGTDSHLTTIPKTKIDTVIRLWKKVFPKNDVLRGSGLIRFKNDSGDGAFKPLQLSQGEKAVFFYIGASLYAPQGSIIFVDSPTMFLHQSITQSLWSAIEELRSDCMFVYQTHDLEFPASRTDNLTIWVRSCDIANDKWDYEIVHPHEKLSEQLILDIIGSRKPVLFVEGDDSHSIDIRLYSLIFPDYTVKPMGSCSKVIETVRSFNDMQSFHHLDSRGIVDRDRRNEVEVKYLREKRIYVPDVAEVENIFMLEGVIRAIASMRGKKDLDVFMKVRSSVIAMFKAELRQQALMHTRHRVKHTVEIIVDQKFPNITALERHLENLVDKIKPHTIYDQLCREFNNYVQHSDYNAVLCVFNRKSMLIDSNVAQLCGLRSKDEYIKTVLNVLKHDGKEADKIRATIKKCLEITDNN